MFLLDYQQPNYFQVFLKVEQFLLITRGLRSTGGWRQFLLRNNITTFCSYHGPMLEVC